MTYFEDLSPNTYFESWSGPLISIGWLDANHSYTSGAVGVEFFRALVRLLVEPWQPVVVAGRFPCPFCRFSGGPGSLRFEGTSIQLGASNIFVPGSGGIIYVSPSAVAHYIDAHEYRPPDAFQDAVLKCPEMGSMNYKKEILARGLRHV